VLEAEESEEVDGEAEGADEEDEEGVADALGLGQALEGLHQDGEVERGQEDGVAERAHHLRAARAERGGGRAGPFAAGEAPRGQAHAQRHQVRQHAEGVRDQRDGVAHVARDQLGHEEARRQHQHEGQPARLPRVAPHGRGGGEGRAWHTAGRARRRLPLVQSLEPR
uniref:Uncharacterized protein n=1 Tax=Anolis carolinensis TaxID=28377 RepID=A0A803THU2_ANOCA